MMKLSSIVSIILLSVNLNAGEVQSDVDLLKTAMSKMILKVNTLEKQNIEVLKMLAKENTKKEEVETYKLMKNKEISDIQQKISILEKKLIESESSKLETQKFIKEQEDKLALLKQKNEQERINLENASKAEQERINLENKRILEEKSSLEKLAKQEEEKIKQLNAKISQEKIEAENKINLAKQEKERIDAENKRIAEERIAIENKKAEAEKQERDIFEKAKVMQEKIKEEERLAKQERERIEAENKRIAEEERKAEQKRLSKKDNYSIDGLFNGTIKETPEEPRENVVVEKTINNAKKETINNIPVNNSTIKEGNVRYVSTSTLSVREKATVNSTKVSELKRGDKIYISGQVGGWCKTELGFVDCKHLDK